MAKFGNWTLQEIGELLEKLGDENARKLVEGKAVCRFSDTELPRFPVTIDYPDPPDKLMDQLFTALNCNFVNLDINAKRFPITGSGIQVVFLTVVDFGRPVTTKEILQEFKRLEVDRPKIEYGLAFGAQYPSEQRKGPIAILSDAWKHPEGGLHIPYLDGDANARYLHLHDITDEWHDRWRFLAVHRAKA